MASASFGTDGFVSTCRRKRHGLSPELEEPPCLELDCEAVEPVLTEVSLRADFNCCAKVIGLGRIETDDRLPPRLFQRIPILRRSRLRFPPRPKAAHYEHSYG